jgi:hypothetical protein
MTITGSDVAGAAEGGALAGVGDALGAGLTEGDCPAAVPGMSIPVAIVSTIAMAARRPDHIPPTLLSHRRVADRATRRW